VVNQAKLSLTICQLNKLLIFSGYGGGYGGYGGYPYGGYSGFGGGYGGKKN
jgi:hypothetical protein